MTGLLRVKVVLDLTPLWNSPAGKLAGEMTEIAKDHIDAIAECVEHGHKLTRVVTNHRHYFVDEPIAAVRHKYLSRDED